MTNFDKETLTRLENIETLDPNTKQTLFNVIDTFLRDPKARMAYLFLKQKHQPCHTEFIEVKRLAFISIYLNPSWKLELANI